MANALRSTLALVLVCSGSVITACGSDSSDAVDDGAAGTSSAGASGATAEAGQTSVGEAGSAGAIGGGDGGTPGAAGDSSAAGSGGNDGEAGSAGAGAIDLVYSCQATTLEQKLCSALVAANCTDPTVCADCVAERLDEKQNFSPCAACTAEFVAFYQCGIDAFEAGMLPDGVMCIADYGADLSDTCYAILDSAVSCTTKAATDNACPTTWP